MDNPYNEDYFQRGVELGISCYSNFRWLPELTIPAAFRLIEYLRITENQTVLDFGASYGYMVKALRLLHRQAWGCDISQHAIENAPNDVRQYLRLMTSIEDTPLCHGKPFDYILARDVLEHVSYTEINHTLSILRQRGTVLFSVIPLGNGKGKYVIPSAENDITHEIREDLHWWCDKFIENGFRVQEAIYNVKGLKDTWKEWLDKKGYGFFTCVRESTS